MVKTDQFTSKKSGVGVRSDYMNKTMSLNTSVTGIKELQVMNRRLLTQLNEVREKLTIDSCLTTNQRNWRKFWKQTVSLFNQGGDKDIYRVKINMRRMSNSTTYYVHWRIFEVKNY